MRQVELGSLTSPTLTPIGQHHDDDDDDDDDQHWQQQSSNMEHNLVDEEHGPGVINDELMKTPSSHHSDSAHGGDSAHRASEATYRRLLDLVDLDQMDDDELVDEHGDPLPRPDAGNMLDVHGGIKITDPQVLDLFVVFGKPFALERGFWTTRLFFSIVQGVIMGFVCLAFFNGFEWLMRTWIHAWGSGNSGDDGGLFDDDYFTGGDDGNNSSSSSYSPSSSSFSSSSSSFLGSSSGSSESLDDEAEAVIEFDRTDDVMAGPTGSQYLNGMKDASAPAMLGTGHFVWVLYTTLGGLVIGLIKLAPPVHFPAKPKGLFAEVKDAHVEARESPGIALCSCISLGVGASVGPEMAMGSLGGGLGTFIASIRKLPHGAETYSSTLTGMAAAMGPLLPSPILSVLLLHELCVMAGKAPEHYMEQVVSFGVASTTSWFIYTYFMEKTLLESTGLPFAINDLISCENLSICHDYKNEWLAEAVLFGFISGCLGLSCLVIMGVFRTINERMVLRMGKTKATLVMPVVGGLLIGLIGVAFPLTFGDGSLQLKYIVSNADAFGRDYLIGTMLMKMLALGISLGFGFIGGQIFPIIFVGACAGAVANLVSGVPIYVTVPCFMAAVPGAFCPIPFTLVGIIVLSLGLGTELTALVFTSVFCSFMTACGSGLLQRLVRKGGERQARLMARYEKAKAAKDEAMQKRMKALENENKMLRKLSSDVVSHGPNNSDSKHRLQHMLRLNGQLNDAMAVEGGVLDTPKLYRGLHGSGSMALSRSSSISSAAAADADDADDAGGGFLNHKSPYL